jgi:hypothetical protein
VRRIEVAEDEPNGVCADASYGLPHDARESEDQVRQRWIRLRLDLVALFNAFQRAKWRETLPP